MAVGKKHSTNSHTHMREKCEKKLKVLIVQMESEIVETGTKVAEEKQKFQGHEEFRPLGTIVMHQYARTTICSRMHYIRMAG